MTGRCCGWSAWEGLTADDLAVALGCSVNAARIRLHRARRRFAEALRSPSLTSRAQTGMRSHRD